VKAVDINLTEEEQDILKEAVAKVVESVHDREEDPLRYRILTDSIGTSVQYYVSKARMEHQLSDFVESTTIQNLLDEEVEYPDEDDLPGHPFIVG